MASCAEPTLGDVVSLRRGTTYQSGLLDQPGPFLLGLASICRDGGFRRDSLRTYGGDSPDKLILRPRDLYVSLKDVTQSGDLLGAVAQVPDDIEVGRLTQDTVKLEFLGNAMQPEYLYWVLRTPQYRGYCRAHAIGTTNLSLSREDFLAFQVPTPTAGRVGLVALLRALDDRIELNRRMNETLDAICRARLRQTVVGADAGRLGDLVVVNGRKRDRGYPHRAIEYVEISGVTRGRFESTSRYVVDDAPGRAQRLVQDGDTIWSCVRPNRRSYAFIDSPPDELVISTGFATLTPIGVPPAYLYFAVTSEEFIDYLVANADGSAYPAVKPEHFSMAEIPVPPADSVSAFEAFARLSLARMAHSERESRTLAALRDLLLPRLISGEIRLRDAEHAVKQTTAE